MVGGIDFNGEIPKGPDEVAVNSKRLDVSEPSGAENTGQPISNDVSGKGFLVVLQGGCGVADPRHGDRQYYYRGSRIYVDIPRSR